MPSWICHRTSTGCSGTSRPAPRPVDPVTRAAELLGGSLEASARLCLLEALTEAAAEITARLRTATVDVRLRGREADLTVTEIGAEAAEHMPSRRPPPHRPHPGVPDGPGAGTPPASPCACTRRSRSTSSAPPPPEGISVNAWLVRVIGSAVHGGGADPPAPTTTASGRRITGFAQA